MLESKDYAKKIALKQQLARAVGLTLIVIAPLICTGWGKSSEGSLEVASRPDPSAA
jgi:hypothetical protein